MFLWDSWNASYPIFSPQIARKLMVSCTLQKTPWTPADLLVSFKCMFLEQQHALQTIFESGSWDMVGSALECEWKNAKEGNDWLLVWSLPMGLIICFHTSAFQCWCISILECKFLKISAAIYKVEKKNSDSKQEANSFCIRKSTEKGV